MTFKNIDVSNPANDFITIESNLEIKSIEIFNLIGQKTISTKELKIDVSICLTQPI